MMEKEILQKIEEQNKKIDLLMKMVDKVRKYFLFAIWVSIALFVIPLIIAMFAVPMFLNTYMSSLEGLI